MKGMLPTEVTQDRLPELIADPSWVFQQKMDGTRVIAEITPEGITYWSRNGTVMKHAAALLHLPRITEALEPLSRYGRVVLDGELILSTGTYHVFDMPLDGLDLQDRDLRLAGMEFGHPVYRVRTAETVASKRDLAREVLEAGGEGIVAKDRHSFYEEGKRVKHQLKVKYVKSADVVVMEANRGRNEAGREIGNIIFGVHLPTGELQRIGQCSIIGKPHVEPGDVIEINYLKFEEAPVQPRMMRVRHDKDPHECVLTQFPEYSYAAL